MQHTAGTVLHGTVNHIVSAAQNTVTSLRLQRVTCLFSFFKCCQHMLLSTTSTAAVAAATAAAGVSCSKCSLCTFKLTPPLLQRKVSAQYAGP
jgi:hypothetical protein